MRDLTEEIRTARGLIKNGLDLISGLRKEMLPRVSPAKLKGYLKSIGYKYAGPWGDESEGWRSECHAIIIPRSVSHEGWDEALLDIIEKLAKWQGQKKLDVLHSIVRVGEA